MVVVIYQVATAPNIPRQPRGSPTRPEQSDLNDTITGLEATSKRVDAERRIDADPSHRIGDPSKAQKENLKVRICDQPALFLFHFAINQAHV